MSLVLLLRRIARPTALLAAALGVAFALTACGSSSSGSNTTTSTGGHGGSGHSNLFAQRLRALPVVPHARVHARLAGVAGLPLPQKLQTIVSSVAMFWQLETQRSQVQFTEPAVNLIDQAPSPCGSGQVATTDPPIYCVPSRAVDLPLSFLQSNIAPLGDAALALVVSNVYGYHIENLLGGLDPSAGLTGAQQQVIDSCFSGVFFVWLESQHALGPGDEASVNKLLAAAGGTSGSAGASGATADQLTTAFNQGLLSRGNTALCLPNHGGGGSPTTTT